MSNNVVIVSSVQQSDSVTHVPHLLQILFPFRLLHNIEHGQRSHGVARVGHDLATKEGERERERENIEQSFLC